MMSLREEGHEVTECYCFKEEHREYEMRREYEKQERGVLVLSWAKPTLDVLSRLLPTAHNAQPTTALKGVKKIEEMFDEQGKIEDSIVHLIGDYKLVLIHSSLSSMSFVQGGAESVVDALKSLQKEGLLL